MSSDARLAHADLASAHDMQEDCAAVAAAFPLRAPSLRFEDFPRDTKPQIEVGEAARRIADALSLHLD